MAGQLTVNCRDASGHMLDGCPVLEGSRQIGRTGDPLHLTPRLYRLCVRLPDGTLTSPPREVEVRDFEEQTVEIVVVSAGPPSAPAGGGEGSGRDA